jgi:GDP-mannose 6-dehydrogenase
MKVSVFGLGYVGCISVGILAEMGNEIMGVDVTKQKVDLINSGKATIVEAEIDEIIKRNCDNGRIKATVNSREAIVDSEVAIICVGTPNDKNGHLDMQYIFNVAKEIGEALKEKTSFLAVAIRSTVMPGTNKQVCAIIEKASGKEHGKDFAVVSNPEFLREGTAVKDFYNPPYTLLASESKKGIEKLTKLYKEINSKVIETSVGAAELIKFVNNTYHALKVDFGNEIGKICKAIGVDSQEVMNLFVQDDILNISPKYFKPGFPYGGSCLPKDLKALATIAHDKYIDLPVIDSIDKSNRAHLDFIFDQIVSKNKRNVGLYGLSFKIGTDDLRFSPAVEIAERLIGKGYNVKVYDKNVKLSRLTGKNKDYLYLKLPHINNILVNELSEFMESMEMIVLVNKDDDIDKLQDFNIKEMTILDGIGMEEELFSNSTFQRIC